MPSAAVSVAGGSHFLRRAGLARTPLYSSTVAIGDHGQRFLVPPDEQWTRPGSRVLSAATQSAHLRQQEAAWQGLDRVSSAAGEAYADASRLALLDLRVLMLDGPPVAAWSSPWRYVWPRDSAFVVAALSMTGHGADATRALAFIQRVQSTDGTFQARYGPSTDRPPDRRGVQLDGIGWGLWGLSRWAQAVPPDARARRLRQFSPLLERSSSALLRLTAGGTSLPPPSPDYWEMPTRRVTLGNAALFLVGLQAANKVYAMQGDSARAAVFRDAATRYRDVVARRFSPNGYPRYADGESLDAAVSFLLPPFVDHIDVEVVDAWHEAQSKLRRPAGGLAPGAAWRKDGVSWTPQTALFAMTAASIGAPRRARRWLDWLLEHRTPAGSFPEKVLSDGSPAAVAPLAWTTAAVIVALETLAGNR